MPTDQAMLNEAIEAARSGDKARARDLLTRLLRIDKDYPEHWLWMSAVVESRQEQIYCLQNLRRVDPKNIVARRGLIMMGALEGDPRTIQPVPPVRKQKWAVSELEIERPRGWRAIMANPALRLIVYLSAGLLSIALITAGVIGVRIRLPATPTPDFAATAAAVGRVVTLTPTLTQSPTFTPMFRTPTPTPGQPTPLVFFLDATYTPTPVYLDTPHPEAEAFRLGVRAQGRGDWEAVVNFMQQTIDVVPDAADAYYYLGDAYLHLGDNEAALAAFNRASGINELFGPAYLGRALARLALDPEADVSKDFRDAISFSSDFGLAYLERARYLIRRGDFESAAEDLIAAETLLPGSPQIPYLRALSAFQQSDLEKARTQAEQAHEGDFTDLPTYLLLGRIEFARGDPAAAAEWLGTYIKYRPDDRTALNLLGQALAQAGIFDEALLIFDRILEEDSSNPDFYLGRGLAYLAVGDAEAALADLNTANRLRRRDFAIMLALGRALIAAGEPGDAFIQLNETLDLSVSERQMGLVFFYRGMALKILVEQGDASSRPAARRDLEKVLALAGTLPAEMVSDAETMLAELNASGGLTPTAGPTATRAP